MDDDSIRRDQLELIPHTRALFIEYRALRAERKAERKEPKFPEYHCPYLVPKNFTQYVSHEIFDVCIEY